LDRLAWKMVFSWCPCDGNKKKKGKKNQKHEQRALHTAENGRNFLPSKKNEKAKKKYM